MYLFFLHTWLRCAFICLRSRYFATLAMCSTCLPILCQCMSRWCFCSIIPHSVRLISKSTSTRGVNRQMMTFWDIASAFLPKKLNRLKKRKFQDWTYINHWNVALTWLENSKCYKHIHMTLYGLLVSYHGPFPISSCHGWSIDESKYAAVKTFLFSFSFISICSSHLTWLSLYLLFKMH